MKVTQVPYRGAGPALVDSCRPGGSQFDIGHPSRALCQVRQLKPTPSSVEDGSRHAGHPTLGELGYKKLDIDFWHMVLARPARRVPLSTTEHRRCARRSPMQRCKRPLPTAAWFCFRPKRKRRGRTCPAQARDQALARRDHGQQIAAQYRVRRSSHRLMILPTLSKISPI